MTRTTSAEPSPTRALSPLARQRLLDRARAMAIATETRRPRKLGTWYVVRDASGEVRSVGTTKHLALAPYVGLMTSREARPRKGQDATRPLTLRRGPVWQFLKRHGWTCTLEDRDPALTPAAMPTTPATTTAPSTATTPEDRP